MKRLLLTIIVSISSFFVAAQGSVILSDKDFILNPIKDSILVNWLNANPVYTILESEEKEAIYWTNHVRKWPEIFNDQVLSPFLKQFPEIKSSYSESLVHELMNLSATEPLTPSKNLFQIADSHARDLGSNQLSISHSSSKGENFQKRVNNFGYFQCISENIYEGKNKGLEAVILLLIDSGVKSLGHRKNILDVNMKYIGVSFFPIKGKQNQFFLVQEFSCE